MADATQIDEHLARRRLTFFVAGLRAKLSWQRVGFTIVVCLLVSTQALLQPTLYTPFDLEGVVRTWLDYLGETLMMGLPIMLAASIVEVAAAGWPRWRAVLLLLVAMTAGAVAGALLLIPYYDTGWDTAFDSRTAGDQVAPPSVVLVYQTFQRPVRVSIHHTRKSPGPPDVAAGKIAFAPLGETGIGAPHVSPPSVDTVRKICCGARGASFAA